MNCELCPRKCGADRENNRLGFCQMPHTAKIAKADVFCLEEPCISGTNGSGTIFFSGCILKCVFCQNYEISHMGKGKIVSAEELANMLKDLESKNVHNINLVNPTHFVDIIEKAIKIYRPKLPIVWNSHGYETQETVERVSKFVDIFLPDLKYFSSFSSKKYSNADNYFEIASKAILKMRELKDDEFDENGMMKSGLIVRHLVLPLHTSDSVDVLKWIKKQIPNTVVSLMSQYTPFGDLKNFPEIDRRITKREYDIVKNKFLEFGLNGYLQERESATCAFIPKWD